MAQASDKTIAGGCCIGENSIPCGFTYQGKTFMGSNEMHEIIGTINFLKKN